MKWEIRTCIATGGYGDDFKHKRTGIIKILIRSMLMQPEKKSKGYGKRPVWQWVLIYLVAAAIVYAIIYLIFFRKSGSSGGGYSY